MKMKRKTRFILILSLLIMLAIGIKPISHGIGKAVLQVISDRMDYEDAYRQKRQAEGHIVGGRGTAVIWEGSHLPCFGVALSLYAVWAVCMLCTCIG